ncbi:MAG: autotransporter-associated beta strand repeat-containing protein [Bacteroides sp.]|nr:autotransporter-associated beta strand repeat-containing protein [Roseburia sp.]MCM1346900.1 autotransporter-associated beta strand repeat-containing protein [Bacteroides sp.]MCM1420621.1 autotransporter-associated beta strand repeat-containing protein [Bacteroides sp.]
MRRYSPAMLAAILATMPFSSTNAQRQQQPLGRGVVAVKNGTSVFVSWRRLAQEPENATYNIYVDGAKINNSPLKNTNYTTTSSVVRTGSKIAVTIVKNGEESALSVPFEMSSQDLRNKFVDISFMDSPLEAKNFNTTYVWPVDLDGDGEMDYVVNRMNLQNSLDCYIEGYLRTGEFLWTVKMGPNELICSGQDDQILAYDIDCDGKGEVVMQTSDGTQFWNPDTRTFGLFVNGSETGDTDGDGIIDYEQQSTRNAPRYMTVVDGMTGKEKCSVEQTYAADCYTRTNRAQLMGDEYNKHVGHVGVFYHDGIHPAVVMEYHTRFTDGSHHYYNGAWAFDFTDGTAKNWHQIFNETPGGPAFHQIRIADPDGDGKDEMIVGGYTMDHNGNTLFDTGIAHGDRFRTSDIDPERPGLETFAIQQYAGDMLGQILYDAATGEPIKKWYLSAVGDVGRGECMDIDPDNLGWEMWSTMGNVYNAQGELIPDLTASYPTEGVWWDGELDREIVQTSDSHYNIYIQDYFKGRLLEIAKLSNWRYLTVYAKRAAFWGDIIGDWREELILRHVEDGVCVGIAGFTTDYPTEVDNIYCLQEDPAYRMQCTTKGYYQSPDPGFYLGYDMPRPQLPPCMVTDLILKSGGEWSQGSTGFTNYERSSSAAYSDGKSVLIDLTSGTDIKVNSHVAPSAVYAMPVKGQTVRLSGSGALSGDMDLWKSQAGTLLADIPLEYNGTTYISEGTLETSSFIKGKTELRARGTLAGNATVADIAFEGALNYEGCRIAPGQTTKAFDMGVITFANGLDTDGKRIFMEMNIGTDAEGKNLSDLIKIEGDLKANGHIVFTIVTDNNKPVPGKYKLIEYTGELDGSTDNFSVNGLKGISYNIVNEDKAIWLVINEQREASADVVWTGYIDGSWNYQTENFRIQENPTGFVANDAVEFNDKAVITTVSVNELMPIQKVTVDNEEKTYTFNGDGGFSGDGMLVKNGNGKLTLNTTKSDYTGATIINGGTVTVKELADEGIASSIGAASASAENLKIGKATLIVNNSNTATNRGMTLTDTATIQVASGTTSLKGIIKGSGTLVKKGAGQLNITYSGSNTWSGGTIIEGGTLAMGTWNTTFGTSTSLITAKGGTIRIFDNNTSSAVPVFNNSLEIEKGKTLNFVGGSRCKVQGKLAGEGTIKISFPYVRGDVSTNMSAFKGTYEVTSGQLRLVSATDLSQATLKLDAGVYMAHYKSQSGTEQNLTTKIGSLVSSATDCTLSTGTYNVGYTEKDDTYAGIFNSNAIINKYGSGTLTLSGSGQGAVNVHEGCVAAYGTASVITGNITVHNGAALTGTGNIQSATINNGGTISCGKDLASTTVGTLTADGTLTVKAGGRILIKARKSAYLRCDALKINGKVNLYSPVFDITHLNGEFEAGDELKIFTGNGEIQLTGTPVVSPAAPGSGLLWDTSSLTSDGTIRVISDPVGISGIHMDNDREQDIYDTSGRRVRKADRHGVYIINQKKILK